VPVSFGLTVPFRSQLSADGFILLSIHLECNADNEIKAGEPIRCRDCGHRIFYKPRTTKSRFDSSLNTFAPIKRTD
jgi:DNA-directed RNA polymerase subunit RPC12/RpoP